MSVPQGHRARSSPTEDKDPERAGRAGRVGGVPQEWDLIIVGGGPAGCAAAAAALLQHRNTRVLLVDRQAFPRDKACGDGIAAEVVDVLDALRFDIGAILDGFPPIEALRLTAPGGAVAERRMARPVHTIPRKIFDARLMDDVLARGAVFEQRIVRSVEQCDDGVVVDGIHRARTLIGADGAESFLRRATTPVTVSRPSVALAIRGYTQELPDQRGSQWITMSSNRWPAYAWSFPIGDGTANVGYGEMLAGEPVTRGVMLQRMAALLPGVGEPERLRAHRLPLSPGRPRVADGRILLAGDALSLINPLSGEGIFYAVLSGSLAGRVAGYGAGAGRAYRADLRRSLGRHLRSTDLAARLTRAPRLIDAGVRAAARNRPVFDDLVRMSLGDGPLTPRLLAGIARSLRG